MLSDNDTEDHYSPTVRLLEVERHSSTSCGFHLTRSKWDPYPWVSGVDEGSVAAGAGMKPGDCLLEVNGEDVVGQRVGEIAELVRSRPDQVSLLLWNAGVDHRCGPETLCCGPMPSNFQRLSACMSAIISCLECPVCLDTVSPPACQCVNGHLICIRCHAKSERCPVCRIRFSRGRSLFADQVYNSLTDAFGLSKESDEKVRVAKIQQIFKLRSKKKEVPNIKVTQSYANKFLARLVEKSSSAENLSNQSAMPRAFLSVQNEFEPNLKTKSLSACDIFRPGSPSVPSRLGTSRSDFALKDHTSYHGSFESLNDSSSIDNSRKRYNNEALYFCPFNADCSDRMKKQSVVQHFQEMHDGPLIQYFKSKISFKLLESHENTYCFNYKEKMLFLRIYAMNDISTCNTNGILVWMWLLDDQKSANEHQIQVNISFSASPEKVLFSFTSALCSLSNVSWKNIMEMQRGIYISMDTLNALSKNSNFIGDIILEVQIQNCDK